jgi:hypothetical protein
VAVANNQIPELLKVLSNYLDQDQIKQLLKDLMGTEAFRKNQSFEQTVTRLFEATLG